MADRQPYLGSRSATTGRTPYLGSRSANTSRTPYLGISSSAPAKHHGGGGFLGSVGRAFSQGAKDLEHVAVNTPAGIAHIAKGDVAYAKKFRHPIREVKHEFQWKNIRHPLTPEGGQVVKSVKETAKHPLRHPGLTLLYTLPAASGILRAGEIGTGATIGQRTLRVNGLTVHPETSRSALGRAVQKGTDTALQSAARRNPGGKASTLLNVRVARTVNAEAKQSARQAKGRPLALVRMGRKLKPGEQKALQVVAEEAPLKARITTQAARITGARTDLARSQHQVELDLLHEAQPHLTEHEGKPALASPKLHKVYNHMAAVANDREELLKALNLLNEESAQARKTNAGRVAIGARYVKPTEARQGIPSKALVAQRKLVAKLEKRTDVARATALAAGRKIPGTTMIGLKAVGEGAPQRSRAASAVNGMIPGPGRVISPPGGVRAERLGAALSHEKEKLQRMEDAAAKRVRPTGIIGQEHFEASPNAVRIPDVATRRGVRSLNRQGQLGAQGTIGELRAPGSTTHPFTGQLRGAEHERLVYNEETGKRERVQASSMARRQDTTALVAETGLEAAKYHGLVHLHSLVRKAVQPAPLRKDDVAVRLDNLKGHTKMPLEVRKFLADPEEFFKTHTPVEEAAALETVKQMLFFPGKDEGGGWHLSAQVNPHVRDEFEKLYEEGKIGWVPKRLLGEMGTPNAPLRAVAPGKAVTTADTINNASRFAVLYLKPAYLLPNVLGNTALNLIQQGWAAPRNLAQAARLIQRLDDDDYAAIDAAVGEGLSRAISAHGTGPLAHLVDLAAAGWSKVVDTPFRRASFIHEARQAGYRTPAQIHELLSRDVHDPDLIRIGIRANRDAIDYEALSPVEREVIRRVVFFYPWVKGSTVYAGRFLREHPVQAAAVGYLGQRGQQYSEQAFGGPLPSRLEGLIPFGGNRAINPSAAALFQTPANVAATVQGLASGHVSDAANAASFFTPALTLAEAIREQRDPATGIPFKPGTPWYQIARKELVSSLPQARLYSTIQEARHGGNPARLYPPSILNALGNFAAGGIYPRTINRPEVRREYLSEQRRLKYGR